MKSVTKWYFLYKRNYVCLHGPEQGKDKMVNTFNKKKDLDRERM